MPLREGIVPVQKDPIGRVSQMRMYPGAAFAGRAGADGCFGGFKGKRGNGAEYFRHGSCRQNGRRGSGKVPDAHDVPG